MSKIKQAVWYPPQFPPQGRLPQGAEEVERAIARRGNLESAYHDEVSLAAGQRKPRPCCKTLHISLFFDGTGNNLNNDLFESEVAPWVVTIR